MNSKRWKTHLASRRFLVFLIPFLLFISAVLILLIYSPKKNQVTHQSEKIFTKCRDNKLKENCYGSEFALLTKKYGLEFSVGVLTSLQELDASSRSCHQIAHFIASSETEKAPDKWLEVLKKISADNCNGGFLHGVIEGKSASDPSFNLNEKTMEEACSLIKEIKGNHADMSCMHFMGHLVLVSSSNSVSSSIELCSKLSSDDLKDQCYGGIFMEYELRDLLTSHQLADPIIWDDKNLKAQEDLCRSFNGLVESACWRELSRVYAEVYKDNPHQIYDRCRQTPDSVGVKNCYNHAMGYIGISPDVSTDTLQRLCLSYLPDNIKILDCIDYVNGFLFTTSTKFASRSVALCSSSPLGIRQSCFVSLNKKINKYIPEEREKLCSGVPNPDSSVCKQSSPLPVDNKNNTQLR